MVPPLYAAVTLTAFLAAGPSTVWSGFRNGGNQSIQARSLPLHWSPTAGIAWKAELPGYGQSQPAVQKDRVFVTAAPGRKREHFLALALDPRTGREVWRQQLPATTPGDSHEMVGRAAPTPIAEGNALYLFFESGDLFRLATKDGRVEWHRPLFQEYGAFQNGHGLGCSPTHTREAVILLVDHQGPSYLIAVDKKSGKTLWKTPRPSRMSWTSPIVTRQNGREVVVVSSSGDVQGYDAGTGAELWKVDGVTGNHIPSPVAFGDQIIIGAAVPRGPRGGGTARTPAQSNMALRLTERDGRPIVDVVWEGKRAVCEYGSPTLHRGLIYSVNPTGVVFCVDAATGEEKYSERIDGPCWAPPVAAGDYVYFFCKNGMTTVVRAGPVFEKVGTNLLWEAGDAPTPKLDYTPPPRPMGAGGPGGRPGGGRPGGREGGRPGEGGDGARASYGPLDPCVYGVAGVDGAFFVRIGTHLFCVRGTDRSRR